MKKITLLSFTILITAFANTTPVSSQTIDDKSMYIYEEGLVIDTAKLEVIKAEKRQILKKDNAEKLERLSIDNNILAKLITISADNGKATDDQLYNYAIKMFYEYERLKKNIKGSSKINNVSNEKLEAIKFLATQDNSINASDILLSAISNKPTLRTYEDKVRKMLKKKKVSELFLPYLLAEYNDQKKELASLRMVEPEPALSKEDIPYKKGLIKKKNPYNRNYCYIHKRDNLDDIDLRMQLVGWEWWYTKNYEEKYTTAPFAFTYRQYKSHPEYRVIGDKVFNNKGNLICLTNLLRGDNDIIRELKEQMLKEIYIQDYKSNKYDILKAPAKTQEDVKNMLGLPFKSFVDAKTAKKNQKIVNDYFKTKADEIKVSNGNWQQRARARARANNAGNKMGALLLGAMFDPNLNSAYSFKNKLEEDHRYDLYNIYKISRVNNTSFKVVFLNNKNKSSYTGLVTIHQNGPYNWKYSYKLIPNEETVDINLDNYPIDKTM